jgi:molecular chaperone GrpE (heat shock protein)
MKRHLFIIICALAITGCNKPSCVEQYKAEKHVRDSVALAEQERSLAYYQSQLDDLMPVADSLLQYFNYERNEKYQDHGYYVQTGRDGLRVLVRDDGREPILMYRNGQRVEEQSGETVERAEHLAVVMRDIKELEKRIVRTSFEIQKYQKRLQKE